MNQSIQNVPSQPSPPKISPLPPPPPLPLPPTNSSRYMLSIPFSKYDPRNIGFQLEPLLKSDKAERCIGAKISSCVSNELNKNNNVQVGDILYRIDSILVKTKVFKSILDMILNSVMTQKQFGQKSLTFVFERGTIGSPSFDRKIKFPKPAPMFSPCEKSQEEKSMLKFLSSRQAENTTDSSFESNEMSSHMSSIASFIEKEDMSLVLSCSPTLFDIPENPRKALGNIHNSSEIGYNQNDSVCLSLKSRNLKNHGTYFVSPQFSDASSIGRSSPLGAKIFRDPEDSSNEGLSNYTEGRKDHLAKKIRQIPKCKSSSYFSPESEEDKSYTDRYILRDALRAINLVPEYVDDQSIQKMDKINNIPNERNDGGTFFRPKNQHKIGVAICNESCSGTVSTMSSIDKSLLKQSKKSSHKSKSGSYITPNSDEEQSYESRYILKHTPSVLKHTEDYEEEEFRTPMENTSQDFSDGKYSVETVYATPLSINDNVYSQKKLNKNMIISSNDEEDDAAFVPSKNSIDAFSNFPCNSSKAKDRQDLNNFAHTQENISFGQSCTEGTLHNDVESMIMAHAVLSK